MANLNVTGNFSTSADSINISYTTDAKNITKIELTKDNTNFITANSFTSSNATFDVSAWDYGTYSCKLRMTHAQNPLTLIQYKEIGDNDEIVDTTDGQWWSIVTPHSVNPNTSYTLSLNHVSYVYVCFYDANGNYLSNMEANTSDWSVGQLTTTFTTVANTAKILFSVTGNNTQPTVSISPNNPLITISNNFNIIITEPTTEPSEPSAPSTDPNTVIEITKAGVPLTPVRTTPTTGQYQVTISNTVNCTARLENDNKTITVTGTSSNDGQIDIRVNIENKRIYTKSIAVATITGTQQINSAITQTANEISSTVSATYATKNELNTVDDKFDNYSTTSQMNSAITQKANEITSSVSETYATKDSIDSIIAGDINLENYPTTIQMNSAINQKANEITSTVSETYATKTTTNNMLSQIQQNANSISTKVDVNGVISSINQSSETISINASKINLNGYVSNDDANWSIDNEGNIRAENLNVEGDLSADTITCNTLNSPKYPGTLDGDIELFVNSSSGNDDTELDDNAVYETVQGALNALPKFLNGKTAHITMQTNSTEDVYLKGFVGGAVRIYMNGKTLYGTIRSYVCSATVTMYGGTKDSTEGATGIIHPNTGLAFASRAVSMGFEACQYIALYELKVYAPDTIPNSVTSTDKVCIASQSGTSNVYCKNIQIVNAVVGFRSNNTGVMHVSSSSGIASKYGFQTTTGGIISLANNSQAGGTTSATNKSSGGQIWYDSSKVTFASGNQTTESGSAPTVSTTKTMTIKSSYGDTYRSSVYNNWKKDGTVRQGDYGYGDCSGLWFFGSAFSELKGKTISKVQITIKRQTGGSYSAVGLVVRTHNYSSRPSGAPTLSSSSYGTLSIPTGTSGTLTITNSDVLNGIKNGTVKGFGIRTTYDSAHYAVCSGSVTVKITYTE